MTAPHGGTLGTTLTVASCRLGEVRFAVAVDKVGQLLARPESLIAVPRRAGALVGAVTLRDAVVPVVDLRRWLPWPNGALDAQPALDNATQSAPRTAALLMVLSHGLQTVAVELDAVEGLRRVSPSGAQQLARGGPDDELFSAVVMPTHASHQSHGDAAPLALLDVAALMRLSEVWAASPSAADRHGGSTHEARQDHHEPDTVDAVACALLESEGELLAIPAAQLRAVLAMPTLQTLWTGDPCRPGVTRWRGQDVPLLRLLPSLGLLAPPGAQPQDAKLLAVVEHGGCCMGIPVQAVCDVRRLPLAQAQDTASVGLLPTPVLPCVLRLPGGRRALLVDVAALVDSDPLTALSARKGSERTQAKHESEEHRLEQAHVVVQAGQPWALPMPEVLEILETPAAWQSGTDAGVPMRHTWQNDPLPVWDLRALLGRGPTREDPATKLLVVRTGGSADAPEAHLKVGLVVERLLHLVPARTGQRHHMRRADGRGLSFIVHPSETGERSVALLEEADWARDLPGFRGAGHPVGPAPGQGV